MSNTLIVLSVRHWSGQDVRGRKEFEGLFNIWSRELRVYQNKAPLPVTKTRSMYKCPWEAFPWNISKWKSLSKAFLRHRIQTITFLYVRIVQYWIISLIYSSHYFAHAVITVIIAQIYWYYRFQRIYDRRTGIVVLSAMWMASGLAKRIAGCGYHLTIMANLFIRRSVNNEHLKNCRVVVALAYLRKFLS